jgi:hypothetical protein
MLNRPRGPAVCRWSSLLAAVACALAVAPAAYPQDEPAPSPAPALHVLAEYEVPSTPSVATNVRWATESTVYLTRFADGVSQVALDERLTRVRSLVPDKKTLGVRFSSFSKLAVSSTYIGASSSLADFLYRPVATQSDGTFSLIKLRVGIAYAFDLSGNRLLFLGDLVPNTEQQDSAGVAWIGPLSATPRKDLHPVLADLAGVSAASPATPALIKCAELHLGAVRFLPDGSFLVVPGFQAGVHLYSPSAQLERTWENQAVGLDAPDCLGVSPEQERRFGTVVRSRFDFLNEHRVLDEILPLPQGPALLVRFAEQGRVHWTLKLLTAGGSVTTYDVPFTGSLPSDRLRGDVRGNKIVLLRVGYSFEKGAPDPSGRLFLAELPQPKVEDVR